eukprot:jgi/Botrbrau1/15401/Bobra.43_2s0027.1
MAAFNVAGCSLLAGCESIRQSCTVQIVRGSPLLNVKRCRSAKRIESQRCSHMIVTASTGEISGTARDRRQIYEGCRPERQNLVALITESMENEAELRIWETAAGRAAMVGFVVAALAELQQLGGGMFNLPTIDGGQFLGALLLASAAFAGVLAVTMRRARFRTLGMLAEGSRALQREVLEAVFSQISDRKRPVDSAVDAVLNKVFRSQSEGLTHLLLDTDIGHSQTRSGALTGKSPE